MLASTTKYVQGRHGLLLVGMLTDLVCPQLLSTVRADRRRLAGKVLNLVDELALKERYLKQVRYMATGIQSFL